MIILRKIYFLSFFQKNYTTRINRFTMFTSSFSFTFLFFARTAGREQTKRSNSWNRSALTNAPLLHSHRASHKFKALTSLPTFRSGQRLCKVGSRKFDYQEWRQSYPRYHVELIVAGIASVQVGRLWRSLLRGLSAREKSPLCSRQRQEYLFCNDVRLVIVYAPAHFFAVQRDEKDYPFVMQ